MNLICCSNSMGEPREIEQRKFRFSLSFILSALVPAAIGFGLFGLSYASFLDTVESDVLKELAAILLSISMVGVFLEVYLFDRRLSGRTAKDVADEVGRNSIKI